MSEARSVNVSLYIEGFKESPEAFARKLGISPDKLITQGVINPGHKVPSKFNYIQIFSKLAEEQDLDKHILSLLDRIGDLEKFKNEVRDCNIGINTVVYIDKGETTPKCSMFLTKETLQKISDISCEMDFDIYA